MNVSAAGGQNTSKGKSYSAPSAHFFKRNNSLGPRTAPLLPLTTFPGVSGVRVARPIPAGLLVGDVLDMEPLVRLPRAEPDGQPKSDGARDQRGQSRPFGEKTMALCCCCFFSFQILRDLVHGAKVFMNCLQVLQQILTTCFRRNLFSKKGSSILPFCGPQSNILWCAAANHGLPSNRAHGCLCWDSVFSTCTRAIYALPEKRGFRGTAVVDTTCNPASPLPTAIRDCLRKCFAH